MKHIFRAISESEKRDIIENNAFNIVPWGLEAKQFTLTLSDAQFFKERFKPASIVRITLSLDYYLFLEESKLWIDDRWVITIQEDELVEFNKQFVSFDFTS